MCGVLPSVYLLALIARQNLQKILINSFCVAYVVKKLVLFFEILKTMNIKLCWLLLTEEV